MEAVSSWVFDALTGLGTGARSAGLLLVGVLDSSLVSLPEINDALIFYLSTISPASAPFYVLASTAGSLAGSLLLNRFAHWRGEAFIAKFVPAARLRRGLQIYQRYGAWTLFVPALLPPPCPYKIFVLSSGAFGLPLPRFLVAVAIGRSLRYSLGAVLAIRYGQQAIGLLQAYAPHILVALGLATLLLSTVVVQRHARGLARTPPEAAS